MNKHLQTLVVLLVAGVAVWLLLGGAVPSIGGGGATHFIVLHDALKDDAKFADLKQEILDSASPVAKEIAAAGWRAEVLDDETTDKDDKPHPLLSKLGVFGTIEDARHELLAVAPPDKLVSKEVLPEDATAESVLALMKARGARK